MNVKAILKQVEKMERNAIGKTAVIKIKNEKYILWYDANQKHFKTTLPDMTEGECWNTRELKVAKKWLIEYYS